tara:strand:- start:5203 stop:5679 length:477 start_codon:yes stop_codon:yes gene_type:complete
MKILKTAVLICTILFAAILWFTGDKTLESQSAFALEPNNHWYWLMHLSIFSTFILDAYTDRRFWSFLVSIFVLGIVAFDMYGYPMLHNIMTAIMAILAVGNIIYYAGPKEKPIAWMSAFVGSFLFLLSVLTGIHIFLGEVVIEFALGVAMTRRIWNKE